MPGPVNVLCSFPGLNEDSKPVVDLAVSQLRRAVILFLCSETQLQLSNVDMDERTNFLHRQVGPKGREIGVIERNRRGDHRVYLPNLILSANSLVQLCFYPVDGPLGHIVFGHERSPTP